MAEPTVSSVRVHYKEDNGKSQTKTIKFKGNFGLKFNNQEYKVQNGKVYNSKGKEVVAMTMSKAMAYQFIGMSNNAESVYDLTYSAKDINQAKHDHEVTYGSQQRQISGVPYADAQAASVIGTGAGRVVPGSAQYENGVYSTKYKSNETGHVNTVSVWLNK